MKQAIIIANGRLEEPPDLSNLILPSSLIIAVDGGVHNAITLGIQPNILIGDFDSIGQEELIKFQAKGVHVLQYPPRKDETDLELALLYAASHKVMQALILGALGARWDMSVANILLAANPRFMDIDIRFLDGTQELFLLKTREKSKITGRPGDTLSLIPLAGDVYGISTHGLEYPLKDESLQFGTGRGVSNVFSQEQVEITYKRGLLLCIVDKTGFPLPAK